MIYWIANFAADAGRYFFFLLIQISTNLAMSVFFRSIVYFTANQDVAQTTAGPFTAIFLLFGGFLVTRNNIRGFLIWVYYLSPFSWTLRSFALNEFNDPRYDSPVPLQGGGFQRSGTRYAGSCSLLMHAERHVHAVGDFYLSAWEIQTDDAYRWAGFGYLMGVFLLLIVLPAIVIQRRRFSGTVGTKRITTEDEETPKGLFDSPAPVAKVPTAAALSVVIHPSELSAGAGAGADAKSAAQSAGGAANIAELRPSVRDDNDRISEMREASMMSTTVGFTSSALPFQQLTLAWHNVSYTIHEGTKANPVAKQLLKGVRLATAATMLLPHTR